MSKTAMFVSLNKAMSLPQASYQDYDQLGDPDLDKKLVSAGFESAVIVNNQPSSTGLAYACTKSILYTCIGIVVENKTTGITALAHLRWCPAKGLMKLFDLMSSEGDELEIHLIGANVPVNGVTLQEATTKWSEEMQDLLDVINNRENTTLKTFDVGRKPHPAAFAVVKVDGKTAFVRGTKDISCDDDTEEFREHDFACQYPFRNIEEPKLPIGNLRNAEFFDLTYDVTNKEIEKIALWRSATHFR